MLVKCATDRTNASEMETSFFFTPSPSGLNKQEDAKEREEKNPSSLEKKMRVAPDDVDFDTC